MYEDFIDDTYEGPDAYLEDDENDEMDIQLSIEDQAEEVEEALEEEEFGDAGPGDGMRSLVEILISGSSSSGASRITVDQFLTLLRGHGSVQVSGRSVRLSARRHNHDGYEEEEEEDEEFRPYKRDYFPEVNVPQKAGLELLYSGDFGRVEPKFKSRAKNKNISRDLLGRRASTRPYFREDVTMDLVPNTAGTTVASYEANIYSGQFSLDSSFYYTCCQDFRIHVYDMTAPIIPRTPVNMKRYPERFPGQGYQHKTSLKTLKTIQGQHGRWTITDTHLSPDNQKIIYSSMMSTVYMTKALDSDPVQVPLHLGDRSSANRHFRNIWSSYEDDRIYSCRFSADGNEVIAGGSGPIYVYDLLADRRTVKINAHADDVNSCCWADTASGNVLVSASDDSFLKVWDRRSLGDSPKPSGVLIGHTEGITYVSPKGDGRYIISNGKDQTLRLWDLRKMRSSTDYENVADKSYGINGFDYRHGFYPQPRYSSHPQDCSVMAYRGHEVLRTLIRCHFSPAETTGSQYLFSGSSDGKIHIWSLDGTVVQVLDRDNVSPMSIDPSGPEERSFKRRNGDYPVCVRDVSWHSKEPVLMSSGWEDYGGLSSVVRHEWKGLNKMNGNLKDWVAKDEAERKEELTGRSRSGRRIPGSFAGQDDEDDEEEDEDWA